MRLEVKLTKQRNNISMKDIEEEYRIDFNDIFNEDNDLYRKLIWIINNKLTEPERSIILYYAETKKQDIVAKALGVSTATVNKTIKLIREEIINYLYGNNTESNTDNNNNSNTN